MREKSANDLKRRVEEMIYTRESHAVPGHDEIIAQREQEESKIDADQNAMIIIKNLYK